MSDNNKSTTEYAILYVDNNEKLQNLCESIKDAAVLILDTEFIREKTYRAKLCLIQIATDDIIACVDPIALDDISPLMAIIHDSKKLKVLHSARQDYEIFYDLDNKLPTPLFDTQLAASLLGYGEQVGYGALVNKVLNVQLDKAHTRTDWSKRPLSQAQIHYASDDVFYLRQLYPLLKKQLIEQGRESWLNEEFEALCQPELFITRPEDAWQKVKGINRLKPRQLAAAKNIAQWREEVAIKSDRPRRWILADDILLAASQLLPKNISQLGSIANINKMTLENSGKFILSCVKEALELNESELPSTTKPKRLTADQEVIADLLMAQLRLVGNEQNISPSNIANRKMIEKVIYGDTEVALLRGWRYQLAGKKIQELLSGKVCLQIENNKVSTIKTD
ncbi:MAG: ribonuclease D [Gammaproteobacteria bacterium]|nr:ribonuclease D [Gammaproteobacteria bacterium]MCW8988516.1 ribonuclease D [Gammaproteobacteria bacterium]MCW9032281.1 ribonuclease D [Gammaproteobacteria bacterium]